MQLAEIAADTALLLSMKDSELKRLQKLRTKEKEEMKKEKQLHYLDLEKERKEMNERRIHEINMEKNRYEGKVHDSERSWIIIFSFYRFLQTVLLILFKLILYIT